MRPCKAVGRNEMPFGRDTRVVPSNIVLHVGPGVPQEGEMWKVGTPISPNYIDPRLISTGRQHCYADPCISYGRVFCLSDVGIVPKRRKHCKILAYVTSYRSSIVTLVLSCPVSEILQVSGERDPTPIPPEF